MANDWLDSQFDQLFKPYSRSRGPSEDTERSFHDDIEAQVRAEMEAGPAPAPVAEEESFIPRPVRTAWNTVTAPIKAITGITGGLAGSALGAFAPESYKAAQEELRGGRDPKDIGAMESAALLPGAGDVAAQFFSPETRESLVGRALGPAARIATNIAADPTTYLSGVGALAKLTKLGRATSAAGKTARIASAAEKAAEKAALAAEGATDIATATRAVPAAHAAEELAQGLRGVSEAAQAEAVAARSAAGVGPKLYQEVLEAGDVGATGKAFGQIVGGADARAKALGLLRLSASAPIGPVAGLAYAPEIIEGIGQGAQETGQQFREGNYAQGAASGVNTLLQTGLLALVRKGVISEREAYRTLQADVAAKRIPDTPTAGRPGPEGPEGPAAADQPAPAPAPMAPSAGPGTAAAARVAADPFGPTPGADPFAPTPGGDPFGPYARYPEQAPFAPRDAEIPELPPGEVYREGPPRLRGTPAKPPSPDATQPVQPLGTPQERLARASDQELQDFLVAEAEENRLRGTLPSPTAELVQAELARRAEAQTQPVEAVAPAPQLSPLAAVVAELNSKVKSEAARISPEKLTQLEQHIAGGGATDATTLRRTLSISHSLASSLSRAIPEEAKAPAAPEAQVPVRAQEPAEAPLAPPAVPRVEEAPPEAPTAPTAPQEGTLRSIMRPGEEGGYTQEQYTGVLQALKDGKVTTAELRKIPGFGSKKTGLDRLPALRAALQEAGMWQEEPGRGFRVTRAPEESIRTERGDIQEASLISTGEKLARRALAAGDVREAENLELAVEWLRTVPTTPILSNLGMYLGGSAGEGARLGIQSIIRAVEGGPKPEKPYVKIPTEEAPPQGFRRQTVSTLGGAEPEVVRTHPLREAPTPEARAAASEKVKGAPKAEASLEALKPQKPLGKPLVKLTDEQQDKLEPLLAGKGYVARVNAAAAKDLAARRAEGMSRREAAIEALAQQSENPDAIRRKYGAADNKTSVEMIEAEYVRSYRKRSLRSKEAINADLYDPSSPAGRLVGTLRRGQFKTYVGRLGIAPEDVAQSVIQDTLAAYARGDGPTVRAILDSGDPDRIFGYLKTAMGKELASLYRAGGDKAKIAHAEREVVAAGKAFGEAVKKGDAEEIRMAQQAVDAANAEVSRVKHLFGRKASMEETVAAREVEGEKEPQSQVDIETEQRYRAGNKDITELDLTSDLFRRSGTNKGRLPTDLPGDVGALMGAYVRDQSPLETPAERAQYLGELASELQRAFEGKDAEAAKDLAAQLANAHTAFGEKGSQGFRKLKADLGLTFGIGNPHMLSLGALAHRIYSKLSPGEEGSLKNWLTRRVEAEPGFKEALQELAPKIIEKAQKGPAAERAAARRLSTVQGPFESSRVEESTPTRDLDEDQTRTRVKQAQEAEAAAPQVEAHPDLIIVNHYADANPAYVEATQAAAKAAADPIRAIYARLEQHLIDLGIVKEGDFQGFKGFTVSEAVEGLYFDGAFNNLLHHYRDGQRWALENPGGDLHAEAARAALATSLHEVLHAKFSHKSEEEFLGAFRKLFRRMLKDDAFFQLDPLKKAFDNEGLRKVYPEFDRNYRSKYGRFGGDERAREGGLQGADQGVPREAARAGFEQPEEVSEGGEGRGLQPRGAVPGGAERAARGGEGQGPQRAEGDAQDNAAPDRPSPRTPSRESVLEESRKYGTPEGVKRALDDTLGLPKPGAKTQTESNANLDALAKHIGSPTARGMKTAALMDHIVTELSEAAVGDRAHVNRALSLSKPQAETTGALDIGYNLLKLSGMSEQAKAGYAKAMAKVNRALRGQPVRFRDLDEYAQQVFGVKTPEDVILLAQKAGVKDSYDFHVLREAVAHEMKQVEADQNALYDAVATRDPIKMEAANRAVMHSSLLAAIGLKAQVGLSSESARMLSHLRKTVGAMDPNHFTTVRLKQVVRQMGATPEQAQAIADALAKAAAEGNYTAFEQAFRGITRKGWFDKVLEFTKAGMLGMPTQLVNLGSNAFHTVVIRNVEEALATALDAFGVYKLDPEYRKNPEAFKRRHMGELVAGYRGYKRAFGEAIRDLGSALSDVAHLRAEDPTRLVAAGAYDQIDTRSLAPAIGGKFGEFVRTPFKVLSAVDDFFKHMSRTQEFYKEGHRLTMHQKKVDLHNPAAVQEEIQRHVNNMYLANKDPWRNASLLQEYAPSMLRAHKIAQRDTFQAPLEGSTIGEGARRVQEALQGRRLKALQLIVPFIKTPANVAVEAIARTPYGLWQAVRRSKEGRLDGDFVGELAKPIVGSAIMGGAVMMAMEGWLTGQGDPDPFVQQQMKDTGWQPYSIRFPGGHFVPFNRFEPVSTLLGFAADIADAYKRGDTQNAKELAFSAMGSLQENLTNKTFLQGLEGAVAFWNDPVRYSEQFMKQIAMTAVPNSIGLVVPVGGLARAIDPVYRQTTALTAPLAKIPGLSKTLPAQYSTLGEERQRPGNVLSRLLSPIQISHLREDVAGTVAAELTRIGYPLRRPADYLVIKGQKVQLKPAERELLAASQKQAVENLYRVITDPSYQALPDNEMDPEYSYPNSKTKEEVLRDIFTKHRRQALQYINAQAKQRLAESYLPKAQGQ